MVDFFHSHDRDLILIPINEPKKYFDVVSSPSEGAGDGEQAETFNSLLSTSNQIISLGNKGLALIFRQLAGTVEHESSSRLKIDKGYLVLKGSPIFHAKSEKVIGLVSHHAVVQQKWSPLAASTSPDSFRGGRPGGGKLDRFFDGKKTSASSSNSFVRVDRVAFRIDNNQNWGSVTQRQLNNEYKAFTAYLTKTKGLAEVIHNLRYERKLLTSYTGDMSLKRIIRVFNDSYSWSHGGTSGNRDKFLRFKGSLLAELNAGTKSLKSQLSTSFYSAELSRLINYREKLKGYLDASGVPKTH